MAQSPPFYDLIKIYLWGRDARGMLAVTVSDKLMLHFLKVWNNIDKKWLLNSIKCQESVWRKEEIMQFYQTVRILLEQSNWKTPILHKDAQGWALWRFLTDLRVQINDFSCNICFSKFFLRRMPQHICIHREYKPLNCHALNQIPKCHGNPRSVTGLCCQESPFPNLINTKCLIGKKVCGKASF